MEAPKARPKQMEKKYLRIKAILVTTPKLTSSPKGALHH
jgi:hypothetical protein